MAVPPSKLSSEEQTDFFSLCMSESWRDMTHGEAHSVDNYDNPAECLEKFRSSHGAKETIHTLRAACIVMTKNIRTDYDS